MSIISLLNRIKENEIFLPNIQRKFVWREEKIYNLMDSIMRGYPIGIILLWETYEDVQYRKFAESDMDEVDFKFVSNHQRKRITLVLDGQQRLQSLYIALYGTYSGKTLCMNVLSGLDKDNSAEIKYEFRFLTDAQREEENSKSEILFSDPAKNDPNSDHEKWYFVPVQELFNMGYDDQQSLISAIEGKLCLDSGEKEVINRNLHYLSTSLQSDENILKHSTVDENKPLKAHDRKSTFDILEVFVRVNTQGTPLTRTDLIFSMMKLNWAASARNLPEFVDEINRSTAFNIEKDFVIKCLFTVSGFGPKYELDLLRSKGNVIKIQNNFDKCCEAIRSCIDFVRQNCWIDSAGALPGINMLIPFVYYLYHLPTHVVTHQDIPNLRKFFYFTAFTRLFTRYADQRILAYTRDYLNPALRTDKKRFPYEKSIEFLKSKNYGFNYVTDELLNSSRYLVLNLLQRSYASGALYWQNQPEVDHIFPQAVLRENKVPDYRIDHYANFWYLPLSVNRNKSAKHPAQFMKENNIPSSQLEQVYIDPNLLDYALYKDFIDARSAKIREHVEKILDLNN